VLQGMAGDGTARMNRSSKRGRRVPEPPDSRDWRRRDPVPETFAFGGMTDWRASQRVLDIIEWQQEQQHAPRSRGRRAGRRPGFLSWLHDNHFTFSGCRRTSWRGRDGRTIERRSRFRAWASWRWCGAQCGRRLAALPPVDACAGEGRTELMVVTKVGRALPRARPGTSDYVAGQAAWRDGSVCGRRPLPGPVFTSTGTAQPSRPPVLRRKELPTCRGAQDLHGQSCRQGLDQHSRNLSGATRFRPAATTFCKRRSGSCTWASASVFHLRAA